MTTSSFDRLATETVDIKRAAAVVSGKRAETPSTVYSGVKCTKLFPVDAETLRRLQLNSPYVVFEMMTMGTYVIENGDLAVIGGTSYKVKAVEPWTFRSEYAIRLIVEEDKS